MAVLKIITAPDAILKMKSENVDKIDKSIKNLMDDMLETMYHDKGVGLAAIQVGVAKKIIVLDLGEDSDHEEYGYEIKYPLFMVNPVITSYSEEIAVAPEGCLSVPDLRFEIQRPFGITVEYLDYNSNSQKLSIKGWLARAIQHEHDHLEGKLIIDHLSSLKKNIAIQKLKKIKKCLV